MLRCKDCIWYRDCLKTEDVWVEGCCEHYDGLLPKDRTPLDLEKDYDEEDLAYLDYQVYVEGIGWCRCDPLVVKP